MRYCVVHCDVDRETCLEWNRGRDGAYSEAVMDDLLPRFERPDSKFRWESPLFTLGAREVRAISSARRGGGGPAAAGEGPAPGVDLRAIVDAALGRAVNAKRLTPGSATSSMLHGNAGERQREQRERQVRSRVVGFAFGGAPREEAAPTGEEDRQERRPQSTTFLHDVDRATQRIINAVAEQQQQQQQQQHGPAGGGGGAAIDFDGGARLRLRRKVPLSELKTHKRTFISICSAKIKATGAVRDPTASFVEYLNVNCH